MTKSGPRAPVKHVYGTQEAEMKLGVRAKLGSQSFSVKTTLSLLPSRPRMERQNILRDSGKEASLHLVVADT